MTGIDIMPAIEAKKAHDAARQQERVDNQRAESNLIAERDAAEAAFIRAFEMVTGYEPEFEKGLDYDQCLEEMRTVLELQRV